MKFSRLGSITKKSKANNDNLMMEYLVQAGQAKQVGAGIYSYGTILLKAQQNLESYIRAKLEKYDCAEVRLPLLQPKQLWVDSGRWDKYVQSGQMFTTEGRGGEYCLAPTGEEVMFNYVNTIIQSYKDMPLCIYQIGAKYRDEIRVRGGILRSKEFIMKDAYSFSCSNEDMVKEYEKMKKCYLEIFDGLGLKVFPVMASSGDMGGKISEEFMTESALGEDTILLDEDNQIAFNSEVLEDKDLLAYYTKQYPNIQFDKLKEVRTIELGHIFQLNQFYSKSMGGVYTNNEGKQANYEMGCYGIGITRTLGTIIDKYCDDYGLRFPEQIEPYHFGIANLNEPELIEVANKVYNKLLDNNIPVLWDDRENSLGYKLKDLKLLGVRKNIIIGKKYLETGLFELETDTSKTQVTLEDLLTNLK